LDPDARRRSRGAQRQNARRRARRQRVAIVGALAAAATIGAFLAWRAAVGRETRTQGAPRQAQATVSGEESHQSPETPRRLLRGYTIVIDPGHNGGNALHGAEVNKLVDAGTLFKPCDAVGTSTDEGFSEAEYNLDVARRLARRLRRDGGEVVLTRTTNTGWGPCITRRAAIGNRAAADAAISIHADGGPPAGRGFHVIYPPSLPGLTDDIAKQSRRLALCVRSSFSRGTGMPYATYVGRKGLDARSDLGGLNLSDVPKVFIETGNMRNAVDASLLTTPRFREREARALERGLEAFLVARQGRC
jgi:N-acetylmuramoyl-L-alanine amidase